MAWEISVAGETFLAEVRQDGEGRFVVSLDGEDIEVDACFPESGVIHLIRGGEAFEVDVQRSEAGQDVTLYGTRYEVGVLDERRKALAALGGGGAGGGGGETISTSMPGKVVAVLVSEGEIVAEGQGVVVVEAMKMENELAASGPGQVQAIHVAPGDAVEGGAALVLLAPLPEES